MIANLRRPIHVHEEEPRRVPNLVGECAVAFSAGHVEGDVGAGRGHGGQREAHRVGAVLLDDFDGIDDVALGLGHLFAVGVADQGVDINLAEGNRFRKGALASIRHRHVAGKPAAQHDHARHPEEEDVEAGDQEAGGIEGVEIASSASSRSQSARDLGHPKYWW